MKVSKSKKVLETVSQYNTIANKISQLEKEKKALRNEIMAHSEKLGSEFRVGNFLAKVLRIESWRFDKKQFIAENSESAYQSYTTLVESTKISIKAA